MNDIDRRDLLTAQTLLNSVAARQKIDSHKCSGCGSRTFVDREAYKLHEVLDAIVRKLARYTR